MKRFSIILYAATLITIGYFLISGLDYYRTAYVDRPHHEDYRALRPAGNLGIVFGYVGSAMMILMLTYSLRKRTKALGKKISLRSWLRLHIYLGVCGPLFIILHSSFKVQGLIAVAFWSMIAVALSGFVGRYLYQLIPRNQEGDELTMTEIDKQMQMTTKVLREKYGLAPEQLAQLETMAKRMISTEGSFVKLLIGAIVADLTRPLLGRRLMKEMRRSFTSVDRGLKDLVRLALERASLARHIEMLDRTREVFHYWHVIHKPFAIIMYLIMGVHIGIAVWTGFAGLS